MQTNPFDDDIRRLQGHETALRAQCAQHYAQLAWYKGFDPEAAIQRRDALVAAIDARSHVISELIARSKALAAEFSIADEQGSFKLNPLTWLSSERAVARRKADALATRVVAMQREIDAVTALHKEDTQAVQALHQDIATYGRFDSVRTREAIVHAEAELATLVPELQQLQARKRSLDAAIAAPLRELRAKQAERGTLQNDMRLADQFKAQLDRAHTGYDKAMAHQACERKFNDGSPGSVKNALRRRLAPLERTINKLEKQIADELRRAQLDVRALIIDGSNIANDASDTFIGLAALEALLPVLARGRQVVVNFDPGFPRMVRLTRREIQQQLPQAKVYFVPRGSKADPFLIQFADDNPHTYVISNDRYADFAYRETIGAGRVLKHAILNGYATIPDLRISVSLPETAPAS